MSITKKPMLSTTHAIFKGLQNDLVTFIAELPRNMPPQLYLALRSSHCKLMLDPRIRYKGLQLDHEKEPHLLALINRHKEELQAHYDTFYGKATLPSFATPVPGSLEEAGLSHFTACYAHCPTDNQNELQDFFSILPENFSTCDPIDYCLQDLQLHLNRYSQEEEIQFSYAVQA
ncbi:hypothetical protein Clacol_002109 [Clathrus columnatus]|uniref:Uncharacterized protein n=1 Tax=Clathrus columnatus TaxID=1419009 RepID=A0AAV5A5G9_9AGAM|nr:hypothetical protein Clacol_002109 [Clathrus columnatus]